MRIAGAGRRRSMRSWPIYWVSVRCVRSAVEASRAASAGRGSALASHGTSHVYTVTDRKDSSARARVRRRTEIHFFVFSKWKCTLYRSRTHTTQDTHDSRVPCIPSIGSSSARHGRDHGRPRDRTRVKGRPNTPENETSSRSRALVGRRPSRPWPTVPPRPLPWLPMAMADLSHASRVA